MDLQCIIFAGLIWSFILGTIYLICKGLIYIYRVATSVSGIHYIKYKRKNLQMKNCIFNPFYLKVDYESLSSSVNCVMKCERRCDVIGLAGVPIYFLFEFLNSVSNDLHANSDEFRRQLKHLESKCAYVNDSFILTANIEKTFKFHLSPQVLLSENEMYLRKSYPFVILMMISQEDLERCSDSYVIATAYAMHLPDTAFNKAQLIGHFVKLSSGHVGKIKTVFRSEQEGTERDLCIICFQQPISVVQVACCHACLCRLCYDKCNKCPLCRNGCMDFFEL